MGEEDGEEREGEKDREREGGGREKQRERGSERESLREDEEDGEEGERGGNGGREEIDAWGERELVEGVRWREMGREREGAGDGGRGRGWIGRFVPVTFGEITRCCKQISD